MDVLKQFEKFKQELLSNSNFTKSNEENKDLWNDLEELDDNLIEMSIEDIEEDYDYLLSSNERDYIFLAGSSLVWNYSSKVNEDFIYGGFKMNGLWESLVVTSDFWKIDFSLAPDVEVPEELKHFEKLNWFEKQAWGDDERFGCFIREKGVFPPKIAFFDRNWYKLMDLSLEEYFEAMFASCAVKGWQYFYIDIDSDITHLEIALEDMDRAVRLLPKIFPDRDFSYHSKRLEEIRKKSK